MIDRVTTGWRIGANPSLIRLSQSAMAIEVAYASSAYIPRPTAIPWIHREGVLWHQPSHTDLLFITLNKSEALFSPSTRYRDLALGPSLFHWESQSTTTAASPTGQRTIHHEARGSRVLKFVREHRREGGRAGGVTEPFRCLGFVRYESHEGERILFVH
jgi:hypothetical protein